MLKQFYVFCQDICFDGNVYNLENILASGGLKSFVSSRFSEGILTKNALQLFNKGKLKGIKEGIETLRDVGVNISPFFLTPFGLIHSQDIITKYKPCIEKLSKNRLEYFLTDNRAELQIQKTLETRPDLLFIYMKYRTWKFLNILDYIPSDCFTVFMSDVTPRVNVERAVYLSEKRMKTKGMKRFGTFFSSFVKEILKNGGKQHLDKNKVEEVIRSALTKEEKNKNLLKMVKNS